tara:strand:+ start:5397 stop:5681 length:285 start_codon:yes stop_codon:yes gene_type:complete
MEILKYDPELLGKNLESSLDEMVVENIIIANLTRSYDRLSQWKKLRPESSIEEEEIYMEDIENVIRWHMTEDSFNDWKKERESYALQFTQEALL